MSGNSNSCDTHQTQKARKNGRRHVSKLLTLLHILLLKTGDGMGPGREQVDQNCCTVKETCLHVIVRMQVTDTQPHNQ